VWEVVRLGRLERPTSCFGGTRSIQLSYSRIPHLYHAPRLTRILVPDFRTYTCPGTGELK
jgi:hypothetical protein